MKTMILAAGLGTRFRPHTEIFPKPALPFLNIPLIDYSIFLAEAADSRELIVNTHHLPAKVEATVKSSGWQGPVHFSFEENILGNGGALGQVRPLLAGDHFMVLNSDTIVLPARTKAFQRLQEFHLKNRALATLMVMPHPEVGTRYNGVWLDENRQVVGFGKTTPDPRRQLTPYHFFGVRLFSPDLLPRIPAVHCDIFSDVLKEAIADNEKVQAVIEPAVFFDGGYLEGFLNDSKTALEIFERSEFLQEVAQRFWPDYSLRKDWRCGTGYQGPSQAFQQPHRLFGKNVKIESGVEIAGLCILGDGVTVKTGSRLKNTVVRAGVSVTAETDSENQLVLR